MKQFATLVFIAGLFSNHLLPEAQYANGACTGDICALIRADQIECIQDPDDVLPTQISLETYTEAGTNASIAQWNDVAVSPIDGKIYVMYAIGGFDKIGTIDDPLNNACAAGTCQVTPIASLNLEQYSGMTFDCLGNLYGISKAGPVITQIDTVSGNDTVVDTSVNNTCTINNCVESLFYNFDNETFYRISSNLAISDMFYIRDTIDGADTGATGITIPTGVCNSDANNVQYEAVTYIGNEVSLISCTGEPDTLLLLQGTPDNPAVTVLNGSTIISNAFGIFNYNEDGSICKPPSCTDAPTRQPTSGPTAPPVIGTTLTESTTSTESTSVIDDSSSDNNSDSDGEVESESLEKLKSESESEGSESSSANTATTATSASTSTPATTQRVVIRSDSDSGSDSGSSSSDSGEDAFVINKENDNGFNENDNGLFDENSNGISDNQTVDLGNKSIINLWVLFGAFTIVNIIVFWWCGKRKRDNDASFVVETENKMEVYID